jgi:hypothetical protein
VFFESRWIRLEDLFAIQNSFDIDFRGEIFRLSAFDPTIVAYELMGSRPELLGLPPQNRPITWFI